MKQFLLSILLVLLWILPIQGENKFIGTSGKGYRTGSVASGAVTQANMRISAVNMTAFTDFTLADVLTNYLNYFLVVKDSAGRVIQGYIKAAGGGETLGSEILTAWTNLVTYPFDTFTSSDNDITSAIATSTADAFGFQTVNLVSNRLYKNLTTLTLNSGAYPRLFSGYTTTFPNGVFPNTFLSAGVNTRYRTSSGLDTYLSIYNSSAATNFSLTSNSLKQVLTPSATGVTITSTKGGSTFNWEAKDASFNYNDASGYTYTIYLVQ